MRTPKKRHTIVAALALAFAAVPAVTAVGPAHAATYCEYFYGPTPSAEIDLDGDGNPEVRVPSLSEVTVCAGADVLVHGRPLRVEQCEERNPRCWRILAHLQAGATATGAITLCKALDGARTCSYLYLPPWTITTPDVDTLCIGVDLDGGRPCAGGTALIAFE